MKKLILILLLSSFQTFAAELKIEPIYGFQRNYHALPEPPRYRTEIFVGVRGTYGTDFFGLESEISQSNSDDTVGERKVKYSTQSLMAGLIMTPIKAEYYNVFMRAGIRIQKKKTEVTINNTTDTTEDGPNLDPYAGGGIGISFGDLFSLNASATLVYNRNAEPGEQYDTRYTLGAGIKFGNK